MAFSNSPVDTTDVSQQPHGVGATEESNPKSVNSCANHGSLRPTFPLDHLVMGYPKLAGHMALIPETAMFRRFGALNALNLLYLQNKLVRIERDLIALEWLDHKSDEGKRNKYAQDCFHLENARFVVDGNTEQHDLLAQMRDTLHQYNHALIQQHTILRMGKADSYDMRNLQSFHGREQMGDASALCGEDRNIWGSSIDPHGFGKELVVLKTREGTDSFSRELSSMSVSLFKLIPCTRFKKLNPEYGVLTVRDDRVFRATFWITSIIASMLPVISIVILKKLNDVDQRLGVIAAFNALISVCLLFFTDAKRTDVFAVTAAFAAVQVVFVGQALD